MAKITEAPSPSSHPLPSSPLDAALRRCGASMVDHGGHTVAVHFGSPTSEMAACLSAVGIADRCDRATLEITGPAESVELALARLGESPGRAWWAKPSASRAIIRCEQADAPTCLQLLGDSTGASVQQVDESYAAIELIGPDADALVEAAALDDGAIVIRGTDGCLELLVAAGEGDRLWDGLLEAGHPLHLACIGFDALEHLAASHRLQPPPLH